MNCLYVILFFNIVAGIVQTFIKFWNQLLYHRVMEVCRLPFEPCHDFFLHLIIVISPSFGEFTAPPCHILPIHNVTVNTRICLWISAGRSLLRWEIVWRNAPRSWRDFGSALPFPNTSHSNKADSTAVTRARFTGKGSRSTAVLP